MCTGTYNAFYGGGNTVNYPEADRYAGGYQRNVPTIDLTRLVHFFRILLPNHQGIAMMLCSTTV